MNLRIDPKTAPIYFKSQARISGIISEVWAAKNLYCPKCGNDLTSFPQNSKVNDFYCGACANTYQIKSSRSRPNKKVKGAAYHVFIDAINNGLQPNYILIHYTFSTLKVVNVIIIPKEFISIRCVEKRRPLPITARRAGWVGCNILMEKIPDPAKIFMVKDSQVIPKPDVMEMYKKLLKIYD